MRPLRILVTGSRSWTGRDAVRRALLDALTMTTVGAPVLVHGRCPQGGADLLADQVWRELATTLPEGVIAEPEQHPVDRYPSFAARNQAMVDAGAHVCLAFATSWASGTGQTARMARRAGIRTVDYGVDTRAEARP